ncbi:hypothetical protein B0H19DRAFT_1079030 [Mycena capillaripes]|nr:hypothetical protein B0H19DRAFT_1079030 [Mycena capillaripes]
MTTNRQATAVASSAFSHTTFGLNRAAHLDSSLICSLEMFNSDDSLNATGITAFVVTALAITLPALPRLRRIFLGFASRREAWICVGNEDDYIWDGERALLVACPILVCTSAKCLPARDKIEAKFVFNRRRPRLWLGVKLKAELPRRCRHLGVRGRIHAARRQNQGNYLDRPRSCNAKVDSVVELERGESRALRTQGAGIPMERWQSADKVSADPACTQHASTNYGTLVPRRLRYGKPGYSDATVSEIIGLLGLGKLEVTIRKKFIASSPHFISEDYIPLLPIIPINCLL